MSDLSIMFIGVSDLLINLFGRAAPCTFSYKKYTSDYNPSTLSRAFTTSTYQARVVPYDDKKYSKYNELNVSSTESSKKILVSGSVLTKPEKGHEVTLEDNIAYEITSVSAPIEVNSRNAIYICEVSLL